MKVFGITIGSPDPAPLMLGAQPAVNLLPSEVLAARKSRGVRRGIVAAAIVLIVSAGGGTAAAKLQALAAEVELAFAEAQTVELLARQAEFADVLAVEAEIEARQAAREVATGTEIDWRGVIDGIVATLPEGATLVNVTAEGSSPMAGHAQPVAPLQGARVATVTFTVRSTAMLPDVVDALEGLPGFVDAQVPTQTVIPEEGIVDSTFVVHLDEGAYTNRFPPTVQAQPEPGQPAAGAEGSTDAEASGEEGQQ